jgi:hypothetical protein
MNSEERAIYAVALACLAECSEEELEALRAAKACNAGLPHTEACQATGNNKD